MAAGGIRWYGRSCQIAIDSRLRANIERATHEYAFRLIDALSVQGPPRSSPGDPPHMDTQALVKSIDVVVDPDSLVGQISSDVEHAVYMELGTETVAARPAWVPTAVDSGDDLARILAR